MPYRIAPFKYHAWLHAVFTFCEKSLRSNCEAAPQCDLFFNCNSQNFLLTCSLSSDAGVRALANDVATTGGAAALTVALCTSACKSAKYQYAGLEYAGECYCANSIGGTNGPAPDGLKGCNMPCNGNATEYCGGPSKHTFRHVDSNNC